jgi:uncharacterized protein YpiB (UPF0302 family)
VIKEQLIEVRKTFNFHKRELYFILDYLIEHPAILKNAHLTNTPIKPYLLIQEDLPQIVFESLEVKISEELRLIEHLKRHFNQPFDLKIVTQKNLEQEMLNLEKLKSQINLAIDLQDEALFNELTEKLQNLTN